MKDNSKKGIVIHGVFTIGLAMDSRKCYCGEQGQLCDYKITDDICMSNLASHYLRWHRNEIPEIELHKIRNLMEKIETLIP
ncbi:MAG: hypothetical protein Terrestrivirus4_177 [Terrestrivirus sp.]|uniref:Uncharacterized protein n=1 Tax=Terrestrivirus sp. TaxID=2487775 RepID=A0A3G4ZRT5_9VIRU|nr:MAG: hypothetical protein Terrestrivirus4_177 [Terrestrivirus sp.]